MSKIDVEIERFPYCIVWCPIPFITWLFPFIGHMGIADSRGVIYDFAGPYTIGEDNFAFGHPSRYLQLSAEKVNNGTWDEGVHKGNDIFSHKMHNLCFQNCHSHVAECLICMKYNGKNSWNMIILASQMFFCGKFVTFYRTVITFLPFIILVLIVVILSVLLQ